MVGKATGAAVHNRSGYPKHDVKIRLNQTHPWGQGRPATTPIVDGSLQDPCSRLIKAPRRLDWLQAMGPVLGLFPAEN